MKASVIIILVGLTVDSGESLVSTIFFNLAIRVINFELDINVSSV
jgi:hypothetical protein